MACASMLKNMVFEEQYVNLGARNTLRKCVTQKGKNSSGKALKNVSVKPKQNRTFQFTDQLLHLKLM